MDERIKIRVEGDFSPVDAAAAASAKKTRDLFEKKGLRLNIKTANLPLGRITGDFDKFSDSLDAAASRVLAFTATTTAIYGMAQAFTSLFTESIKLEKQLASIQSILQTSSAGLQKFSQDILTIANATGQSFDVAAQAAEEFARQGLSVQETIKATAAALTFSKIAGVSATQAVENLTASLNTFNQESLGYIDIVDTITSLDASFAVSAAGIAEGLKRVGSVASESGVELKEIASLISVVQQVSARGAPVISNGLKTIFTRLGRSGVQDALGAIGVETKDANGEFRSQIEVLKDLSNTFETLSDSQRAFILEQVGGVYQINTLQSSLKALRGEYSEFDRAVEIASDSSGSAAKRLEILKNTTDANFTALKNNVSNFLAETGKVTVKPILDNFIGLGNQLFPGLKKNLFGQELNDGVQEAGSGIGKALIGGIQSVLTGPGTVLLVLTIGKLLTNLSKDAFKALSVLSGLKKVSLTDSDAQKAVNSAILNGNKLLVDRLKTTTDIVARTQILNTLLTQSAQKQQEFQINALVAAGLSNAGRKQGTARPGKAAGFVPNFANEGQLMESIGAKEHGYKAGRAYETRIHDGTGKSHTSYVNSAEDVINFTNSAGKKATMVVPPNGFGKGTTYAAMGYSPKMGNKSFFRDVVGNKKGGARQIDKKTFDFLVAKYGREFVESKFGLISSNVGRGYSLESGDLKGSKSNFSEGFVPNFSNIIKNVGYTKAFMGAGGHGAFYRLTKDIGIKKFNRPILTEKEKEQPDFMQSLMLRTKDQTLSQEVRGEFAASKLLAEVPIMPGVTGVKIPDTVERAVKGKSIRKEIVKDYTAEETLGEDTSKQFGFIMGASLKKRGLKAIDLLGRNYSLNFQGSQFVRRNRDYFQSKRTPESDEEFFNKMVAEGGQATIFDAGGIKTTNPKLQEAYNRYFAGKEGKSSGFVPNFARLSSEMGRGIEGSFHRLTADLGVKRFHRNQSKKEIRNKVEGEFALSRLLSEGDLIPGVTGPKIVDTLDRATRAGSIRKQIIKDPMALDSIGRAPATGFGKILEGQMYDSGIFVRDLIGENYSINREGQAFLKKHQDYLSSRRAGASFDSDNQLYQDFIKAGGKATIIDAGMAEIRSKEAKERINRYKHGGLNKGFIPNFAPDNFPILLNDFTGKIPGIDSKSAQLEYYKANKSNPNVEFDDRINTVDYKKVPIDFRGGETGRFAKNIIKKPKNSDGTTNQKRSKFVSGLFEGYAIRQLNKKGYNFKIAKLNNFGKGNSAVDGYSVDLPNNTINLLEVKSGEQRKSEIFGKFGRFLPENIFSLGPELAGFFKEGNPDPNIVDNIKLINTVAVPDLKAPGYVGGMKGEEYVNLQDNDPRNIRVADEKKNVRIQQDPFKATGRYDPDNPDKKITHLGSSVDSIKGAFEHNGKLYRRGVTSGKGSQSLLAMQIQSQFGAAKVRGEFSSGFVPNFYSPLQVAKDREISAGYAPSEVKVARSRTLANPLNPEGYGVYNSSEGSLTKGISLAKRAGIDPKSKGIKMASSGFIPNFAPINLAKTPAQQLAKKNKVLRKQTYKDAQGLVGTLFKSIPETFLKDGILGEAFNGIEVQGVMNAVRGSATLLGAYGGKGVSKLISDASNYGIKISSGLQKGLTGLVANAQIKRKGLAEGFVPNFAANYGSINSFYNSASPEEKKKFNKQYIDNIEKNRYSGVKEKKSGKNDKMRRNEKAAATRAFRQLSRERSRQSRPSTPPLFNPRLSLPAPPPPSRFEQTQARASRGSFIPTGPPISAGSPPRSFSGSSPSSVPPPRPFAPSSVPVVKENSIKKFAKGAEILSKLKERLITGSQKPEAIEKRQKFSQGLSLASFIVPQIVGSILGPQEERTGTSKTIGSGIESIASGATTAALLGGGPAALALGFGVAATQFFKQLSKEQVGDTKDSKRKLDNTTRESEKDISSVSTFVEKKDSLKQLQDSGASSDKIIKAKKELNLALSGITDKSFARQISSEKDPEKFQEKVLEFQKQKQSEVKSREGVAAIDQLAQKEGEKRSSALSGVFKYLADNSKGDGSGGFFDRINKAGEKKFTELSQGAKGEKEKLDPQFFDVGLAPIIEQLDLSKGISKEAAVGLNDLTIGASSLPDFLKKFGKELGLSEDLINDNAKAFEKLGGEFDVRNLEVYASELIKFNGSLQSPKFKEIETSKSQINFKEIFKGGFENLNLDAALTNFKQNNLKGNQSKLEENQFQIDSTNGKFSEKEQVIGRANLEKKSLNQGFEKEGQGIVKKAVEGLQTLVADKNLTPEVQSNILSSAKDVLSGGGDLADLESIIIKSLGESESKVLLKQIGDINQEVAQSSAMLLNEQQTANALIEGIQKQNLEQLKKVTLETLGRNVLSGETAKGVQGLSARDYLKEAKLSDEISKLKDRAGKTSDSKERDTLLAKADAKNLELQQIKDRAAKDEEAAGGAGFVSSKADTEGLGSKAQKDALAAQTASILKGLNESRKGLNSGEVFSPKDLDKISKAIGSGNNAEAAEFIDSKLAGKTFKPLQQSIIDNLRTVGGKDNPLYTPTNLIKPEEPAQLTSLNQTKRVTDGALLARQGGEAALDSFKNRDPLLEKYDQAIAKYNDAESSLKAFDQETKELSKTKTFAEIKAREPERKILEDDVVKKESEVFARKSEASGAIYKEKRTIADPAGITRFLDNENSTAQAIKKFNESGDRDLISLTSPLRELQSLKNNNEDGSKDQLIDKVLAKIDSLISLNSGKVTSTLYGGNIPPQTTDRLPKNKQAQEYQDRVGTTDSLLTSAASSTEQARIAAQKRESLIGNLPVPQTLGLNADDTLRRRALTRGFASGEISLDDPRLKQPTVSGSKSGSLFDEITQQLKKSIYSASDAKGNRENVERAVSKAESSIKEESKLLDALKELTNAFTGFSNAQESLQEPQVSSSTVDQNISIKLDVAGSSLNKEQMSALRVELQKIVEETIRNTNKNNPVKK